MSKNTRKRNWKAYALILAALGDETRLSLVSTLAHGRDYSISELTSGTSLTRQAVTKHLGVLEKVGLVTSSKVGRESLYRLSPEPLDEVRAYLGTVSRQWDDALSRLKNFVEE